MALADRIREEIESNVADEFDPTIGHSPDLADYSGVNFEETQIEQEPGGDWYEFDWVDESLNTEYYYHIRDEWAGLLSNKRFLGVDGGSTRVERDRVHYIDARAGYASTDATAEPVQKVEELDRNQSFFLIDKAIADEDATVYEQIIDFLVYESDTVFWTTWDSDSDPQNQSLGIEVKLRTLTELNAIRKISEEYDSSEVDFVLKDGSIYPTSVKAVRGEEERVHEDDRDVLDTIKEIEENDFLVVGLVKRVSTAAFAQEMAKLREDIDSDRFNDDYTFLQGFLEPMQRTPYFIYNPKGAKRVEEERWKPVCGTV